MLLYNARERSFRISAQSQMMSINGAFVYYNLDYNSRPYIKKYNSEEIITYLLKWYVNKEQKTFGNKMPLSALLYSGNSKNIFCNAYNLDANDLIVAKKLWKEKAKQLSADKNEVEDLPLAWEVNLRHDDEYIVFLKSYGATGIINKKKFYEIKNFVDAELEKMKAQKQSSTNSPIDGTREFHRKISSESLGTE